MGAAEKIIADDRAVIDWTALDDQVDGWRGAMVQRFAQAEAAASETLVALRAVPDRGVSITLPHLTGQRFEQLATALAVHGPFAAEGKLARSALSAFRNHQDLRPLLCHGATTVTSDRRGRWQLRLDMLHFCATGHETRRYVVDQTEAEALLLAITADMRRLCSQLGQVRKALAA